MATTLKMKLLESQRSRKDTDTSRHNDDKQDNQVLLSKATRIDTRSSIVTDGSYGRLIVKMYCDNGSTSLNQVLLEKGKAVVYEDLWDVSDFANDDWVTRYDC